LGIIFYVSSSISPLIGLYFALILVKQNPWLGGCGPHVPIPSAMCSQLNVLNPPAPPNKISWYATAMHRDKQNPYMITDKLNVYM
jgi:hypothetical protein